ncbi:MAG: trigger factor [Bacteroidales bacterium]|nr:trigger factor [Bacteroidales bacterium]MCF8403388.1 trigger factor [Bacteroidales bacterium]
MNITQESTGDLTATIKIEVAANDYESKVNEALKEVQKKSSLKGFRPGKVPYGLIKKMYGKSVLADEVNKLLSESLNNYIVENKLEILGYPLASENNEPKADFENDTDFEFFFDIGLAPELGLELNDKIEVEYFDIQVEDDKVDGYLKEVTARNGQPFNPETAEEGDLIKGDIIALDNEGNVADGAEKHATSLSIKFIKDEKVKKKFVGCKKDDKVRFNPLAATENETETASMLGIKKEDEEKLKADYEFTVTEISRIKPAEVNQELFDRVYPNSGVDSEEAFREKLRSEAKEYFQRESDNFFVHEVMEKLIHDSDITFPGEFVKRWLISSDEKITKENIDEDYDSYLKSLKQQLIVNKIATDHDLKVENKDIRDFVKKMYAKQFMFDLEDEEKSKQLDPLVDSVLQNQEEVRRIYDQLFDDQVRELFKSKLKLKTISTNYDDFIAKVNDHHKHHHHEHE